MCKDSSAGLFSVLLLLLLCISGCYFPNSVGMRYGPPREIVCGKPWLIELSYHVVPLDPKQKHGKLTERIKDVVIYIHNSSDSNFIAIPLSATNISPEIGEIQFNATMKPVPCDSGIEYVEYYIEETCDCVYNRTRLYRVPVGKN